MLTARAYLSRALVQAIRRVSAVTLSLLRLKR
jgi:hypothetical protein